MRFNNMIIRVVGSTGHKHTPLATLQLVISQLSGACPFEMY